MNCPNCQQDLKKEYKFCPYCGVEVNKNLFCPSCGSEVEPKWVSCPNCRVGLGSTSPRQSPQRQMPRPEHQPYGYRHSSSGRTHRRKKGFLGSFFSS
jgi:hypothetical protein